MWSTLSKTGIVNKAEVDVFLELSCFFCDPADVGNLISGSSAFSKSSFNIWQFTVHILLEPGLENFEHYFASVWDECNYISVWMESDLLTWWNHSEHLQKLKLLTGVRVCVCVCVTPWTVAHQAPLSTGFSRQEYWSGLPIPPPRDLPNSGIRPAAPTWTGRFFSTEPLGNTYWPLTLRLLLRLGYVSCGYLTAQSPEMNGQGTSCPVICDSKCC